MIAYRSFSRSACERRDNGEKSRRRRRRRPRNNVVVVVFVVVAAAGFRDTGKRALDDQRACSIVNPSASGGLLNNYHGEMRSAQRACERWRRRHRRRSLTHRGWIFPGQTRGRRAGWRPWAGWRRNLSALQVGLSTGRESRRSVTVMNDSAYPLIIAHSGAERGPLIKMS